MNIIFSLFLLIIDIFYTHGSIRKFPEGFKFGVATSSYQIEGGWNASGKGENIWDRFTQTTNIIPNKQTGNVACDSYHLYERDVQMLAELNVDFYRFSLSWSRILPNGFVNKINPDGLNYYNKLIDSLLANNIEPVITLYHYDLPQKLQELGGWVNPVMVDYFTDYARVAFEAFGDRVKTWLTFNQPGMFCSFGYEAKQFPPPVEIKGIGVYLCTHTILKAHARVYHLYDEIYRASQKGRISLTLASQWAIPISNSQQNLDAAERNLQFSIGLYANPIFSRSGDYPKIVKDRITAKSKQQGFLSSRLPEFTQDEIDYIRGTSDFFGLNHYTSNYAAPGNITSVYTLNPSLNDDQGVIEYQDPAWLGSTTKWLKVVPWGFTSILGWIRKRYNNPEVMVFANGYSEKEGLEDFGRIDYYHKYLNALLDAIDEGSKITAYTAWSLMDNFEWTEGYTKRFGLYHVDFRTLQRTPKKSALFYRDIIREKLIKTDIKDYGYV